MVSCCVFQVAFIPGRGLDLNSASMVAVGAGGWVHMWNVYGGGLMGETFWVCVCWFLPFHLNTLYLYSETSVGQHKTH